MEATASTLHAPAQTAGRSLLGMDAVDRRRMLEMEERIRPVRAITMAALAVAVLISGAWIGYWTIIPVVVVAGLFLVADWISRRVRYPEYAIMTAWVLSQATIGVAVALTGGADSPILVVAAMPIVSLSARFPVRVVAGGVAITLVIMAAATFGVDPDAVRDDPTLLVLSATVVVSVGVLSTALLRSDLEHRDQAVVDPLTGMLNRTALDGRVAELEQQSRLVDQPVAVVVADVDRFKSINDKHGHAAGDVVLSEVSEPDQDRVARVRPRLPDRRRRVPPAGAGRRPRRRKELADRLRDAIDSEPLARRAQGDRQLRGQRLEARRALRILDRVRRRRLRAAQGEEEGRQEQGQVAATESAEVRGLGHEPNRRS